MISKNIENRNATVKTFVMLKSNFLQNESASLSK